MRTELQTGIKGYSETWEHHGDMGTNMLPPSPSALSPSKVQKHLSFLGKVSLSSSSGSKSGERSEFAFPFTFKNIV